MLQPLDFGIRELHAPLYAIPSVEHQCIKVFFDEHFQLLLERRVVVIATLDLQEQALLQ